MSLLIKGVQIVDGEGRVPYKADVLVQKNIISAIGNLKYKETEKVIEGLGNYLVPGFIDVDTDSDHYLHLFTNPRQNDFANQGVTTIIGGHCGSSLAPLIYGDLESVQKWGDVSQVNVNWHTMDELLSSLRRLPLGVNFGTLVGHGTIRQAIAGESNRELTEQEFKIFEKMLLQAMEDGAFGMSTGLGYTHGSSASEKEAKRLVGVIKNTGGVYSTHLRNQKDGVIEAVQETVRTANYTGVKTLISHFRPIIGSEEQFKKSVEFIRANSAQDGFRFDIYPHDTSIYSIATLLPSWVQRDDVELMAEELNKPDVLEKIEKEIQSSRIDLANVQIANAPRNGYLVGKTMAQVADNLETSLIESFIKVMTITNFRANVFIKDINFEVLTKMLFDERAFIASNGNSPAPGEFLKHERSTNTFPKFLGMALKNDMTSLPEAIKKITSAPARYFEIPDRGVIKEGKVADMVILSKDNYEVKEVILGGQIRLTPTDGGKTSNGLVKGDVLKHKAL
ncbi:MAG: amidohydrolase family protein [Candidatus Colwellbacteria bacterium]|nr:amidohydrolase family protein [Candidatus Colwellbacteria bacterium]